MKKYYYYCSATMGTMSIQETEMEKKAMSNFLKSFSIKPRISKVKCGDTKYDYYYAAEIPFESCDYLKVMRFIESLRAFCSFWRMSLIEHSLNEIDSDKECCNLTQFE